MSNSNPENLRHYCAGFLGSAVALAGMGHRESASALLGIARQFLDRPDVECPISLRRTMEACEADPCGRVRDIAALETMFVHEANANLEKMGIRLGNG